MIKYIVIPEKKTVIATLEHTEWDAFNKISKMVRGTDFCVVPRDKFLMPDRFKVKIVCDERDEFNEEFGKKRAKKVLLDNYYKSLDKRIAKFREAALEFNGKVFETPANLLTN